MNLPAWVVQVIVFIIVIVVLIWAAKQLGVI
jgi:hypothetical protein